MVTGSTGWLGGKLCEALVARGVKVVGLARRETKITGVKSLTADLATGAGLEKLNDFDICEIDCCVHLAAVAGWGELGDCLEVNVQGTRRLLDALAPPGGDPACNRFVIASSISTVGTGRGFPPQQLPMSDAHPYVGYPWAYALSKWQMEQLRTLQRFFAAADRARLRITHKERNQWGCDGYRCVEYALVSEAFLREANGAVMCATEAA